VRREAEPIVAKPEKQRNAAAGGTHERRNSMLNKGIRLSIVPALMMAFVSMLIPVTPAAARAAAGQVFAMTNAFDNQIAVYDRAADGSLSLREYVDTDGMGVANTTEPVDALGSQNPLILSHDDRWLLAVNAGSDEISVFRVTNSALTLTQKVASGGPFPASLALHGNLLYVLNGGNDGNVTGFRLSPSGHLTAIAGSTRGLDAGGVNPPVFIDSPAQVGFSPDGRQLVVTVKAGQRILVYSIDSAGLPSAEPVETMSENSLPFSFAFDRHNHLLVAEPFGGEDGESGAVRAYDLAGDGTLEPLSESIDNDQIATCWLRIHGAYAYVTNNGTSIVSSYSIANDGGLTLLHGDAAETGERPVDLAISRDGRFLYTVNAGSGTVSMFRVDPSDGGLTSLGEIGGLPKEAGAVGIAVR
jgi:6-phosphogluconolactonase (cycloisomerase 2 family)